MSRAPAATVSIQDLEQSIDRPSAGQAQPSLDALEQRARAIIYHAYQDAEGAKRWQEDFDATIASREKRLPKPTQRTLWCLHAATTLLCCTVATFVASMPENFSDYSKSSVLNWAVDLATYSLFVTFLPMAHHLLNQQYAKHRMQAGQLDEERDPLAPRDNLPEDAPDKNLVELSKLKLFKTRMTHMALFRQIAVTHFWSFREHLTQSNSTAYASMLVEKAYDSSLGKTAILTLLPLLMAKMPGSTEATGKFRGGNFGWDIAASWLVLTFHDDIRKKLVKPVATIAATGFYAVCVAVNAVAAAVISMGQSAYCCCGPEDGAAATRLPQRYNAHDAQDLEWEAGSSGADTASVGEPETEPDAKAAAQHGDDGGDVSASVVRRL